MVYETLPVFSNTLKTGKHEQSLFTDPNGKLRVYKDFSDFRAGRKLGTFVCCQPKVGPCLVKPWKQSDLCSLDLEGLDSGDRDRVVVQFKSLENLKSRRDVGFGGFGDLEKSL